MTVAELEQHAFRRAQFDPLGKNLTNSDHIHSLSDLINFNAAVNPEHTFCIQTLAKPPGANTRYGEERINFKDLKAAVDVCSAWLEKEIVRYEAIDGMPRRPTPVALYLESDVSLFIYVASLLALNVPAVLLSARLGTESVRHLLSETSTRSILVSKRTERLIAKDVTDMAEVNLAPAFPFFLDLGASFSATTDSVEKVSKDPNYSLTTGSGADDSDALILHSSGTTGLPKPIRLGRGYLLGYAACHSFRQDEDVSWPNFSSLPLYHGFGMLAPCLSLAVGMPCVLPPHSTIPAAHSTMELMTSYGVQSLMTVPSIIEDILLLVGQERDDAFSLLRRLRLVAVGGGPLNSNSRDTLVAEGIKLLNHYGATEIGAIAPIFQPGVDYDARYLRLRSDIGLQLHPIGTTEEPQRFKLVGKPFGWGGKTFEVQDELVKRPGTTSAHVEVQILGRSDDLIVLNNGEKVVPRHLEDALMKECSIKTAVCVGQGKFELAVLVEPSKSIDDVQGFVDYVWQILSEKINPALDAHARISSSSAIIVKPSDKEIPRSDKGSVMRREVHTIFDKEIHATYDALELESFSTSVKLDMEHLESSIRKLVDRVISEKLSRAWRADDDLFELGMDSLQATRLSRFLNSAINDALPGGLDANKRITPAVIYKNPSLRELALVIGQIVRSESSGIKLQKEDRALRMQALVDEYLNALEKHEDFPAADDIFEKPNETGAIILMTGSTGNLGVHLLSALAQSNRVSRIVCCIRHNSQQVGGDELRARQEQVNANSGVSLTSSAWQKISFVSANPHAHYLGWTHDQLAQLGATITHIVHLAWPMDFNRQLESFRSQLNILQTLIRLARSAHRSRPRTRPPRLVLASSIAVVRHYNEHAASGSVPEAPMENPLVTTEMGYAEAKWVCEQTLERIAKTAGIEPVIVRIGQLSGPEDTPGIWKTEEHVPALIKASQLQSAFPDLKGDFSWLPVDRAARSLMDLVLRNELSSVYYHLENPIRQPWATLGAFVIEKLGLKEGCIPFETWLERMAATGQAASLVDFFRKDFEALASGTVVLDTTLARATSVHLRGSGGLSKALLVEYVQRWKKLGFLA